MTHNVRIVRRVLVLITITFLISIMNMIITVKIHDVINALIVIQWVMVCARVLTNVSLCKTRGVTKRDVEREREREIEKRKYRRSSM